MKRAGRSWIGRRARALLVGLGFAVLVVGGCSGDSDAPGAASDSTSSTSAAEVSSPSTGPLEVSVDDLGLESEVRECVVGSLPEGSDPARVLSDVVDDALSACRRGSVFAGSFVDRLAEDNPGVYSSEQLACLTEAYGSLSNEDVQALVAAGLDPQTPSPAGDRVFDELFGSCDAPRPSE